MRVIALTFLAPLLLAAGAPMVVVHEDDTIRREPPPHGEIGMSTAYRISDFAPQPRTMEFRRRVLDVGAAIGEHPIGHDEVYYVTSGRGLVISDGVEAELGPGMAAYLYEGAVVGIRQLGDEPLSIIIAYPVAPTGPEE
jgi:mannose-6-phosphate isomerase-like protein (cupin superfamily)